MDGISNQTPSQRSASDSDPKVGQAVTAARRGDHDALRYLYCRYGDRVHAEVLAILLHPLEAQNLTHEVFATLATTLAAQEEPGVPFLAWVMLLASDMARERLPSRVSSEPDGSLRLCPRMAPGSP